MTVLQSIGFQYNHSHSNRHKLWNISASGGTFEESIGGSRQINEQVIEGRDKPYFKGLVNSPLEFDLEFGIQEKLTDDEMREIARWLKPKNYQPLVFEEMPNKIFYCMPIESLNFIHNGLNDGYLTLTMRCNTYHAFSPVYTSQTYQINQIETITMANLGDVDVRPIFYIKKIGDGSLSIKNYSDGGNTFEFENLLDGEEIILDNKLKDIKSNLDFNRFATSNLNWINLAYGNNNVEIAGSCFIYYKCQFGLY